MKCLIIDEAHASIIPLLKGINIEPDYQPTIQGEEVHQIIGDYEGLIVRSKMKIDDDLLSKATKLQFVARAGAGVDQIDEAALESRNIPLFNAPEGNRDAVGEQAVGMLLSLFNRIHIADAEVRQKTWLREENRGYELGRKTVGIIGYGNMGRAFAKRLIGFDCEVIAYDKFKTNYGDEFAKEVELEEIFEKADVLSFHIPLTDENYHLANQEFFEKFKKNIYLINTARGKVIPLGVVVENLKSGKIRGAVLDVLENEKFKTFNMQQSIAFEYLSESDRVLFTPHVAGWTFESYEKINQVLVRKIAAFLEEKKQ